MLLLELASNLRREKCYVRESDDVLKDAKWLWTEHSKTVLLSLLYDCLLFLCIPC